MSLLYLTTTAAVAAAIALRYAIRALLRVARLDALATLPIEPERRVELPAGDVVLHLAGPFGTTALRGMSFELANATGEAVPSSTVVVRSRRSSGLTKVTLAVRRFQVPRSGTYQLRVTGIPPARDLSGCRLVLARPQDVGLALSIIGVVLAAVALVACSVLSLLFLLSPAAMAAPSNAGTVAGSVARATPPPNSIERRAVVDAIRKHIALVAKGSRLRVQYLKVDGRWAYFVGTEIVPVTRDEWQETDLSIEALLKRVKLGWGVVEYWNLPTEHVGSRRGFVKRVQSRIAREEVPVAIFPGAK